MEQLTKEQAKNLLEQFINKCLFAGGVFNHVNEVAQIQQAIQVLAGTTHDK